MPDVNDIVDGEAVETVPVVMNDGTVVQKGMGLLDEEVPQVEVVEAVPDFDPLELLQYSNAQKVKTLESLGVQLGFTVMATRLEAVVELLFDTPEGMRDLDLAFEQKLAPMLDQIAAQVKAQLVKRDAQQGQKLLSVPGGRND